MDVRTQVLLDDLIRNEGRSLLHYVSESFPWTTLKNHFALPILQQIVKEEQEGAAVLMRLLIKRKLRPPYLGAYPMSFTTVNYVSLDHLLPYLIDFEKRRLTQLERDLPVLEDGEARALVQSLIDMKRRHIETLTDLAAGK